MADNKFSNLNARIYQGYDPNTEFNEKGALFSTARFADASNKGADHFLNEIKSSAANIGGLLQNSFLNFDHSQTGLTASPAQFPVNSPGGFFMSSPSTNYDSSSQLNLAIHEY